ncbi:unnamed protein product [Bubo scandiacus]
MDILMSRDMLEEHLQSPAEEEELGDDSTKASGNYSVTPRTSPAAPACPGQDLGSIHGQEMGSIHRQGLSTIYAPGSAHPAKQAWTCKHPGPCSKGPVATS